MAAQVNPRDLQPGQWVDHWRIVRRVGSGTYGVVYEVEKDGQRFALKLACQLERSSDPLRADARAQREAACLQQLKHPHIIRMWAQGRWPDSRSGFFYIVLDFVDGYTLGEWSRRTHPTPHEAVVLFLPLFDAVNYMHELGFVHRDLSLRNIMVTREGKPVIIDFGAADFPTAAELTDGPLPPGTARNRSPEAQRFWIENRFNPQARYTFRPTDDIFALGANLYDVLTDPTPELPRERPPLNDALLPPPSPFKVTGGRVPQALSAYVMMLLRAHPEQRPQTGKDAARPLTEFARYEGPEWRVNLLHRVEEQLPPEPEDAAPGLPPASGAVAWGRTRGRRLRPVFAGVLALGILAAAVAALLLYGAVPSERPPGLAEKPTNHPTALPSARTTQQEASPSVNQPATSPPPLAVSPPQKASSPRELAAKRAKCALLVGMAGWAHAGCAGVPLRPERGDCSIEAIGSMVKLLGWQLHENGWGSQFVVTVDVTKGPMPRYMGEIPEVYTVFKDGPVTGALEGTVGNAPAGTRLQGHLWTEAHEEVIYGRYTRAHLPDGSSVPICVELRLGTSAGAPKAQDAKPGHAKATKSANAWATAKWGLQP